MSNGFVSAKPIASLPVEATSASGIVITFPDDTEAEDLADVPFAQDGVSARSNKGRR